MFSEYVNRFSGGITKERKNTFHIFESSQSIPPQVSPGFSKLDFISHFELLYIVHSLKSFSVLLQIK